MYVNSESWILNVDCLCMRNHTTSQRQTEIFVYSTLYGNRANRNLMIEKSSNGQEYSRIS
jgi:hypothetical protein